MVREKEKWDEEKDGLDDEQDALLSQAISLAIEQGRGWGPGEKEAYLEKILDDDFIPPMFATSIEEVEKSGLKEAFTSLIYDGESPTRLMLQFRKKGNEAFTNGKRNVAHNQQYYRDAVNHYYESLAWAEKIEPMQEGDLAQADTDDPTYTPEQLAQEKATICANIALMHMQLKNWGHVRENCQKAIAYDPKNIKAWYRLAKAHEQLKDFEPAGDAIDSGLAVDNTNADLKRLQRQLQDKISRARKLRQQRERARAERVARIKQVWKHCKEKKILLGRVPLVASVTEDDEEEEDAERIESRWHAHLPHTGQLPEPKPEAGNEWFWPVMFLYPSHNQSDFIKYFGETEMIGIKMAEMFPEIENQGEGTSMPWDYDNEFTCSQLAVYFEVHVQPAAESKDASANIVHPESVELIQDQATCMRFYESTRALKGDEGDEMANVVRAVERKHLYKQQKAWKQKHGSLWAKPDPCPVVRIHPAMTLGEVLVDKRMVVPNVRASHYAPISQLV